MATYSVIKLSHITPLHMGTGRETYDFSSANTCSDTLLSALASTMATLGDAGSIQSFLYSVCMSSAFPYFRDHLFLPVVQGHINVVVANHDESIYRKILKKVKYMELPLWKRMIRGETITVALSQICGEYIVDAGTHLPSAIYKSEVCERVNVSRSNPKENEPFFFEWKRFSDECGLFVLTDAVGEKLQKMMHLFDVLGQQGIGTDKSVGGGKFEVQVSGSINIEAPSDANASLLLSLYLPTEAELKTIDLDASRYTISLRGGFIAGSQYEEFRHLRKKSVYMLNVGSVLLCPFELKGKVIDLQPDWNNPTMHPVYRSGRALSVPIKI